MSTHENRIGGTLCVATTENTPHNRLADASIEVVVRALKSPSDQAGASPWNPYVILRLDMLVKRDPSELPHGQLLTKEAAAAIVELVGDFLARNHVTPVAQPAAAAPPPPKAPETATARQ